MESVASRKQLPVSLLFVLSLLTGPLALAICAALTIVNLPILGLFSILVTVPLVVHLLARQTSDEQTGQLLGNCAGALTGYLFFLLLNALGTQATGRMVWLPDILAFFLFIILPGWLIGMVGRLGVDAP